MNQCIENNVNPLAINFFISQYKNARKKLCASPYNEYWIALVIGAMSRMIAVNSSNGFNSDSWSDFTLAWFSIEKQFLAGNGRNFAIGLNRMDSKFFDNKMAEKLGSRMATALAELSFNANDTAFFAE